MRRLVSKEPESSWVPSRPKESEVTPCGWARSNLRSSLPVRICQTLICDRRASGGKK